MTDSPRATPIALEPVSCTVTQATMERYAELFGDVNSLHTDAEFAKTTPYGTNIVYGMLPFLCLSMLNWRRALLRRGGFQMLTVNFHQPVFVGDRLDVASVLFPSGNGGGPAEFEYEIRHRATGTVVTTGAGLLGPLRGGPKSTGALPEEVPPLRTRMPTQPLVEQRFTFDQIRTGQVSAFDFDVTAGALRALHEILRLGAESSPPGWQEWLDNCAPRTFLLATLFSVFIGMCIPGQRAVTTNCHARFHRVPPLGQRCRMTGTVSFKSATTSTVQVDIVVGDVSGSSVYATGKVHAHVHAPPGDRVPGG